MPFVLKTFTFETFESENNVKRMLSCQFLFKFNTVNRIIIKIEVSVYNILPYTILSMENRKGCIHFSTSLLILVILNGSTFIFPTCL